jgi:signal peptide peptidase SppA
MHVVPHLTAKFFDKPLALRRAAADALLASMDVTGAIILGTSDPDRYRAYGMEEGVAIIPVQGILSPGNFLCGTSYDFIRTGFDAAMSADDVRAIVLDINSPGGTVEGCFDLADHIYAARGKKPIWTILGESAYSAAYAIASAADHITVPRTGGAGSIGVVSCHVDMSKMLATTGIKVTFIQYGARKTDGAAEKSLSDQAVASFQADVDALGKLFVATVARNRGLKAQAIKDTEAATYLGSAAVGIGLCDEILAPDAAFAALLKQVRS